MPDQRHREQPAGEIATPRQPRDGAAEDRRVGPLAQAAQAGADAFRGADGEDRPARAQSGDLVQIVQPAEVDQ
ncbi:hypothetical protein [Micromonospora chersina]|uniref:hypothetical protein n=1 Tax=Micromonospora chersina TaxID=47854 RepID=UPI003673CB6E